MEEEYDSTRALSILADYIRSDTVSDISSVRSTLAELGECFSPGVSSMVAFESSAYGGTGVMAKTLIPKGTCILIDRPCVQVSDVEVGSSPYSDIDGSDSIALIMQITSCFNNEIESCIRSLHPVRNPTVPSNIGESFPVGVVESLRSVLPADLNPMDVVRAIQLNSLGFYTFPELSSYSEHLRFLAGTGLYPLGSMFNHSCEPSVNHYSIGDVTFFRTNRDVAAGEELFISYIGNDLLCETTSVRREFLDSRDFICGCTKCTRPDDSEDIWVEELELADRISIRLQPTGYGRVAKMRQLIRDKDLIHKDRIELEFQICRELGLEGSADWQTLLAHTNSSEDLLAVVIRVHFLVSMGFNEVLADQCLRVAQNYLGRSMGSAEWLGRLFELTDFSSTESRLRFDTVWSLVLASH